MQKSNAPTIITVPFASGAGSGYRNTIPIPSQIPTTPGLASWTDGFPPLTMTQPGAGGIPPYGQDMNGLGFALSTINQWTQLGYVAAYSSSVSTAIGGYPQGACIGMLNGLGYWLSMTDNNTSNPDATGATNWVGVRANAGKSTIAVASGTVTPDPSVLGAPLLILTGTLTANVTLVLPLTAGAGWDIYNGTTGAFTVTVQGATGSGVTATQAALTGVRTDGTNYYTGSLSGGPYLPLTGTAVAATKLATARTIAMTGPVTWSVSFDGSANVTAAATITANSIGLSGLVQLGANQLLGNPTAALANVTGITLTNGLQMVSSASLGLGAITPTSVTASGFVSGLGGIGTLNGGTQGVQIVWNSVVSGQGRNEYINNYGGGAGGHYFYTRSSTTGTVTQNASIDAAGNLIAATNITAGNNIYANGGTMQIGSAASQYTTINYYGLFATNRTINPASSSTLTINLSGAYGGGISLTDGGGGSTWGLFSSAGSLYWGYNANTGGALTAKWYVDPNGNMTNTGTINFSTSDRRVKKNFKTREPKPSHNLWWGDYDRRDVVAHGVGFVAQDVEATHPHRVRLDPKLKTMDGEPLMVLDKTGLAEEQGVWNGRQIDKLWEAVHRLEAKVN